MKSVLFFDEVNWENMENRKYDLSFNSEFEFKIGSKFYFI